MADLEPIGNILPDYTAERYVKKKREILRTIDEGREKLVNGILYCRKCYQPKMADFPERNFVTRCACQCDVEKHESELRRNVRPIMRRELRSGDWNPFD